MTESGVTPVFIFSGLLYLLIYHKKFCLGRKLEVLIKFTLLSYNLNIFTFLDAIRI